MLIYFFFFFKQKTAYEIRPCDWSSDVCSSDLEVMKERGYPTDDFEQRAADISVEHPELVERYRTAHGIAQSNERGQASTEDLRQSVRHYRALFDELLGGGAADEPISRDQTTEEVEADERARTRS